MPINRPRRKPAELDPTVVVNPRPWYARPSTFGVIIALALGSVAGTTLAEWDDAASFGNITVHTGSLDLVAGDVAWACVSPDTHTTPVALDGGVEGDPTSHRIVAGDTVRAAVPFTVKGTGENLKMKISLGDVALTGPAARVPHGLSGTYSVVQGQVDATYTALPSGAVVKASADLGSTTSPVITRETTGTTYTVLIDLEFDPAAPDDEVEQVVTALSGLTINVEQVRPNAA